jgi:hypothetical protein
MDNLSAAICASRIFPGRLTAFIGFIQRRLSSPQGVAEWIGFPWRNESESGGGLRRNTQIDISWLPKRFGVPWCAPELLRAFSMMNSDGIRVLKPGALCVILLMLYGLSRRGQNTLKKHDYESVLYGVRYDSEVAHQFCEIVLPEKTGNSMKLLLRELQSSDWNEKAARKVWLDFIFFALKSHLAGGPIYFTKTIENKYQPLCGLNQIVHYQNRIATQSTWQDFLADADVTGHRIYTSVYHTSLRNLK